MIHGMLKANTVTFFWFLPRFHFPSALEELLFGSRSKLSMVATYNSVQASNIIKFFKLSRSFMLINAQKLRPG